MPRFKKGDYIYHNKGDVFLVKEVKDLFYRILVIQHPALDKIQTNEDGTVDLSIKAIDDACELELSYKKYLHLQGLYDKK